MARFKQLGVQMVVRGAERFARDISHIALSLYNYTKAVSQAERGMARLATTARNQAQKEFASQQRVVERLTKTYEKQVLTITSLQAKLIQMQESIARRGTAQSLVNRYTNEISKLEQKMRDLAKVLYKFRETKDDVPFKASLLKQFAEYQRKLTQLSQKQKEWNDVLKQSKKDEKDLSGVTEQLNNTQKLLVDTYDQLQIETSLLGESQENLTQKQNTLNKIVNASGGIFQTFGKFLSVLTGGFGRNVVGATNLETSLLRMGLQAAAVGVALNTLTFILDAIAILFRVVSGAVGLVLNVLGKLASIAVNAGKAILGYLWTGFKNLAALPFKLIIGGLRGIWDSIRRIGEIAIGMNISNLLWNLGGKLRDLGAQAITAAGDFQLMQIRLRGLVQRELVTASEGTLTFNDVMEQATKTAQELSYWISELAVKSIFSAEDINNTLTLAMAYDFTSQQAKDLTFSIVNFATGMGLTDEQMRRIIENFGQMKAAGKAAGTELRDLARGSFVPVNEIFDIMAKKLGIVGKNIGEVRKEIQEKISEGEIPINDFFEAFIELSGTQFPDAVESASVSWRVVLSNIQDFLQSVIGWRVIKPTLDVVAKSMANFISSLMTEKVRMTAEKIGNAFAWIAKAIQRISEALTPSFLKNGEKFAEILGLIIDSIGVFVGGGQTFGQTLGIITRALKIIGIAGPGVDKTVSAVLRFVEALNNVGKDGEATTEEIKAVFETFKAIFSTVWNELLVPAIKKIWEEKLKPKLEELWGFISGFVTDLWENIIPEWWEATGKPALLSLIAKLVEWVQESDEAKNIGKKITDGIVAGIQAAKDSGFLSAVSGIIETVLVSAATAGVQALIGVLSGGNSADMTSGQNYHYGDGKQQSDAFTGIAGAIEMLKNKAQEALDSSLTEFLTVFEEKFPGLFKAGEALAIIATAIITITKVEFENLASIADSVTRIAIILGGESATTGSKNLDAISKSVQQIVEVVSPLEQLANDFERMADALERLDPTALDFLKNIPDFITDPTALSRWSQQNAENLFPGGFGGGFISENMPEWLNTPAGKIELPTLDFSGLKASFDEIVAKITGLFTPITESAQTETEATELEFQGLSDSLVGNSIIPDMLTAIVEIWQERFLEILGWTENEFIAPLLAAFAEMDLYEEGKRIMNSLWDGLREIAPDMLAWWETIKAQFNIHVTVSWSGQDGSGGSAGGGGGGNRQDPGDDPVALKKGGNFIVPQGYPNDSFRIAVSSGEQVIVIPNAINSIQHRGKQSPFAITQNVSGGLGNNYNTTLQRQYVLNVNTDRMLEDVITEYGIMRLLGE